MRFVPSFFLPVIICSNIHISNKKKKESNNYQHTIIRLCLLTRLYNIFCMCLLFNRTNECIFDYYRFSLLLRNSCASIFFFSSFYFLLVVFFYLINRMSIEQTQRKIIMINNIVMHINAMVDTPRIDDYVCM